MNSKLHNRAFTLVELLTATLLTALLMLILLRAIAGAARAQASLKSQLQSEFWPAGLIRLLRWDLAHAATVTQTADGFVLRGLGALDPQTLQPQALPAQVEYAVVLAGDRRWLIRRQTAQASGGEWSELLCMDVAELRLWRPDVPGARLPEVIPNEVRLVVRSTRADVDPLDLTICLR